MIAELLLSREMDLNSEPALLMCVRATAPELAGDPKFRYITNQLVDNTHLAGDPKRKGCRSLLGWGIINLSTEIMEIINNKVG